MRVLRLALRSLFRSPGFTLPVLLVLGLGVGANVALHAVLQAVLFRPVPVEAREALSTIRLASTGETGTDSLHLGQVRALREAHLPFSNLVPVIQESDGDLPVGGRSVHVRMPLVGEGWQTLLGLKMHLGRGFTPQEERAGEPVLVLSHRLWMKAFQGDPAVVGRSLPLGKTKLPVTVVGVAAKGFEGLDLGRREDCWMPLESLKKLDPSLPEGFLSSEGFAAFSLLGRAAPGTGAAQVQAALAAVSQVHVRTFPDTNSGRHYVALDPGAGERVLLDKVLPQRTLLFLSASLSLLLAVVAASGLFAARAARRERELATCSALGAGPASLAWPMLLEAILLGILAAPLAIASGLLLARVFMLQPGQAAREAILLPRLDARLVALGIGLSLAALVLSALVPVWKVLRTRPARLLAGVGTKGATARVGGWFVAGQVALSLVLLAASSMALHAFHRAARMGYPVQHRAVLMADAGADRALGRRVLARLRAMPDISVASRGILAPLEASGRATFSLTGGEIREKVFIPAALVGKDWFEALGVTLREGRGFRDDDGLQQVILNETLARRFFPGGSAVGRTLMGDGGNPFTVVGVVADHRMRVDPDFHLPMIWLPDAYLDNTEIIPTGNFRIVASGPGSGRQVAARLREALRLEAPGMEAETVITLEDHVAATLYHEYQNHRLLSTFGLGSLGLACFGLWAAVNLQTALRGRELAVRAALGATSARLVGQVMGLGFRLLAAGVGSGLFLVWVLVRLLRNHWGPNPSMSWVDLLAAAGILLVAGLLASLIPALRASTAEPSSALRSQ